MSDRLKAAFTAVSDLVKQLLTVAGAVLTITVTFSKDMIARLPVDKHWLLVTAWLALTISLIPGTWTLMALAGTLGNQTKVPDGSLGIYQKNIAIPAAIHIIVFLVGLTFLMLVGFAIIGQAPPPTP